jgi:deoxyribodipyrimidine photo-lyase
MYIDEPSWHLQPEHSERHYYFILQSLQDLQNKLAQKGNGRVLFFRGEALEIFKTLTDKFPVAEVLSHQETGLSFSFSRDKRLQRFFRDKGILWREYPQDGVIRGLKNRDTWHKELYDFLRKPVLHINLSEIKWWEVPSEIGLPLPSDTAININFQPGGMKAASERLEHYLKSNFYRHYAQHISRPLESRESCSRLSPYLSYGNISVRQVFQTLQKTMAEAPSAEKKCLRMLTTRLIWRSHFMQKFETECRIEFAPFNRGMFSWKPELNESWLKAWQAGETGVPLVDACMRCLHHTGYLNFRMRAMLVSFWTHTLLQPWKPAAIHLARLFLDFEPGIHYPQIHMQAGLTGINTLRIYNPVKQARENDPQGLFIKTWVPEIRHLPLPYLFEPWLMSPLEQQWYWPHRVYPHPIVNLPEALAHARKVLWDRLTWPEVRRDAQRILKRHVKSVLRKRLEKDNPDEPVLI